MALGHRLFIGSTQFRSLVVANIFWTCSRMTKVSGLYHGGGGGDDDDDDSCLFNLLHDFLGLGCSSTTTADADHDDDGDVGDAAPSAGASEGSDAADKTRKTAARIRTLLDKGMAGDDFGLRLAGDVKRAAEEMASLRGSRPAFRRAVASRLREAGYDAAICQTRWRGRKDVSAGSYEYIDVVVTAPATGSKSAPPGPGGGRRYIVDVHFAAEFVVARPTAAYAEVLEALPRALVARPAVAQKVVRAASKAARRSLKSQGLSVPPWRKKRFMAAKWLGPHRRTTDAAAASVAAAGDTATCRTVGFVLGPPVRPWLSS
ncbi:hypothetical protein ACP70R_000065 [Stipagrostis hirtigluma subsp. patula]